MDLNLDNPEQIKQLIMALQKLLPANEESETDEIDESTIKTKTVSMSKKSKRKNKFVDMPEKNMHKEDTAIDKLLNTQGPTPRNREFEPVEVTCRSCHKKEKVSPSLIPDSLDRYRCNKCCSSS
jgi:lysyl-tRNA synthetase class I